MGCHASSMTDRGRLLIVDDLADNRELYAAYFELAGFVVDQAVDGEDALAVVARQPPTIIVMDLSMPRLDGWEATRLIKTNPRTKRIPIVVLTALSDPDALQRARAAGADAVCTKPCLPNALLEKVERLLARDSGHGAK